VRAIFFIGSMRLCMVHITAALLPNYFKARKSFFSAVIEGLNNSAKLTVRRSYGFRTFRILELVLPRLAWQAAKAGAYPRILLTSSLVVSTGLEQQRFHRSCRHFELRRSLGFDEKEHKCADRRR
jgi:hypothetical protein